jgi:hypothetical protein
MKVSVPEALTGSKAVAARQVTRNSCRSPNLPGRSLSDGERSNGPSSLGVTDTIAQSTLRGSGSGLTPSHASSENGSAPPSPSTATASRFATFSSAALAAAMLSDIAMPPAPGSAISIGGRLSGAGDPAQAAQRGGSRGSGSPYRGVVEVSDIHLCKLLVVRGFTAAYMVAYMLQVGLAVGRLRAWSAWRALVPPQRPGFAWCMMSLRNTVWVFAHPQVFYRSGLPPDAPVILQLKVRRMARVSLGSSVVLMCHLCGWQATQSGIWPVFRLLAK